MKVSSLIAGVSRILMNFSDEAVKEALSAELVSIMWWFLTVGFISQSIRSCVIEFVAYAALSLGRRIE
jgi:hypothetical protein